MAFSNPDVLINTLWVLVCAFLVFLMQGGFLCLEAGLTRRKNNINVAIKNIADLGLSVVLFWGLGYGLMFGPLGDAWIDSRSFLPDLSHMTPETVGFFVFQAMFCSTAVTIVSGAVAERMTLKGYLLAAGLVSGVLYPIFGRWVWNGANQSEMAGWLGQQGFIDFAGSTVVHSVGGWAALATVLIVGPRLGRFSKKKSRQYMTSSDPPLALLGAILLWFGWFGFNGGSFFELNEQIPKIIANTLLSGASGLTTVLLWQLVRRQTVEVTAPINGAIAGLVAITANCYAVSSLSALVIGSIGAVVMMNMTRLLEKWHIDDAVGVIPVHLGAGIWGTLAVALFGDLTLLGTGLERWPQFQVQVSGILACGLWSFSVTLIVLGVLKQFVRLRVTRKQEYLGLNISEHGARSDFYALYSTMKTHIKTGDLRPRVQANTFTEVGQISNWYNQVVMSLEQVIARLDAIVTTAVESIVTVDPETLVLKSTNPATQVIFGYPWLQLIGQPLTLLIDVNDGISFGIQNKSSLQTLLRTGCQTGKILDGIGIGPMGRRFPIEMTVTLSRVGVEKFWTIMARDVSDRKKTEAALQKSELEARNNAQQLKAALDKLQKAQSSLLQNAKMNSLGQMVAGVAHEINNPVSFIHGNLTYSREYIQDLLQALDAYQKYAINLPPEVQSEIDQLDLDFLKRDFPEMLNSMQNGTNRIQAIVQSLRNFSRLDEAGCKVVDIHVGLESTLMMLAPQLESAENLTQIEVRKEYGVLPKVECYPGALNQVFFNIIANAIEALRSRQHGAEPCRLLIRTAVMQAEVEGYIAIAISDNGDGIPDSLQQKIFDPFFTTKKVGDGTGMGLAISYQIVVDQHGGQLQCHSQKGEGTTFTITLPLLLPRDQQSKPVYGVKRSERSP